MTEVRIKEFQRVLKAKKSDLLARRSDREEIVIQNAAEDFDRLQQQMNREVAIRNLDRESKLLKDVQAALNRIEVRDFAVCLRCEEEIPEKRLQAVPWAAYCVSCQESIDCKHAAGEAVTAGTETSEPAPVPESTH